MFIIGMIVVAIAISILLKVAYKRGIRLSDIKLPEEEESRKKL